MFMNNLDFRRKSPSPPIPLAHHHPIDESPLLVSVPMPPPPAIPYIGGGRENDWKRLRLHNLPPRMRAGSVTTTTTTTTTTAMSEPSTPLNDRPRVSTKQQQQQQGKGRSQHLLVKQGGRPSRNLPPRMLPTTTNTSIRGQRSTPDLRPPPPPQQQTLPPLLPPNTLRKKFRPPLPLTLTQLPPPSPSSSCESDAPLQTPSPPPLGLARYNRELGLEFEALQLSDLVGFGISVGGGGEFTPKPMPNGNDAASNFFGAIGDRRPLSRSNSVRTTYSISSALGRATSISSNSHSSCSTPTYASHYSCSSSCPPPSPSTAPTSHHSSSLGRSKSSCSSSRYVPNPAFDPFALDSDSERERILPQEVGERVVEEDGEEEGDVDSDGEADDGHGN